MGEREQSKTRGHGADSAGSGISGKAVRGSDQVPGQLRARPLGLTLLILYAVIFAGIAPLGLSLYLLFTGQAFAVPGASPDALAMAFVINVLVVYHAVGAWRGRPSAARWFLIMVTVHYVAVALNNLILLQFGELPPQVERARLWGRVIRGGLYPAVYWWYFRRPKTKAYFHR